MRTPITRALPLFLAIFAACGSDGGAPTSSAGDPSTSSPTSGVPAPDDGVVDGGAPGSPSTGDGTPTTGGDASPGDGGTTGGGVMPLPDTGSGPALADLRPYAIHPFEGSQLSLETFPRDRIVSGGVPRDGIPALNNPRFVAPGGIAYLADDDLVLGVVIDGKARAYPHNIGWWHEIVNDRIGDRAISVTFCPLTGTGLVFDATGVDGDRKGETLTLLPVVETTWRAWKTLYPDTGVIESGTYGPDRYTRYPYGDYRTDDSFLIFGLRPTLANNTSPFSSSFGVKDMVLGLRLNGEARAYPFDEMGEQTVVNDHLGDVEVVVAFDRASQLAVPFARQLDEQVLTFELVQGGFPFQLRDQETGSTWDITGRAIEGPLTGKRLTQVPATTPSGSPGSPSGPRPTCTCPSHGRHRSLLQRLVPLLLGRPAAPARQGGPLQADPHPHVLRHQAAHPRLPRDGRPHGG